MIHYYTALQRDNFDYDIFTKSERQKTFLLDNILGSIGAGGYYNGGQIQSLSPMNTTLLLLGNNITAARLKTMHFTFVSFPIPNTNHDVEVFQDSLSIAIASTFNYYFENSRKKRKIFWMLSGKVNLLVDRTTEWLHISMKTSSKLMLWMVLQKQERNGMSNQSNI